MTNKIQLEKCNHFAGWAMLWFINTELWPLPFLLCFLSFRGNGHVWMGASYVTTVMHHNGECMRQLLFHDVHTEQEGTLLLLPPHPIPRSVLACMCTSIFSITHRIGLHSDVSGQHHVKGTVRWSLTLLPTALQKACLCLSAGGRGGVGSRADLIVRTRKWTRAVVNLQLPLCRMGAKAF